MASYQAIVATLGKLDDEAARAPSALPGWSRAHVVSHLARHADSHVRMLQGLRNGQSVAQYAGGAQSRKREIERAVGRKSSSLVDDFKRANEALFAVWEELPPHMWDQEVEAYGGRRPAALLAWARWRELEVHHVDLDLGFGREHWPLAFVMTALQRVLDDLPRRQRQEMPAGTWAVETTDRPGRWVVHSAGDPEAPLVVEADPSTDEVAGRVAGPAADVLAWLLGRLPTDQLVHDGDEHIAALPARFPYP